MAYESIVAELRTERARILAAIAALEPLRLEEAAAAQPTQPAKKYISPETRRKLSRALKAHWKRRQK
jgi:hypothetical protein